MHESVRLVRRADGATTPRCPRSTSTTPKVDAHAILGFVDVRARTYLQDTIKAAAHHDALHELPKITELAGGVRRIVDRPPVITHPAELTLRSAESTACSGYRESLQEDRRVLLDRYRLVDTAMKVVGIGSVGLGAFIGLFEGTGEDDPLFLQAKEAEASVLERFLKPSPYPSHGERIVTGQRRLQATSDILLGWTIGEHGRHIYVRQLQDQKGAAVVEAMTADDLEEWGELCAWALARGHARSGDPALIAGYLGDGVVVRPRGRRLRGRLRRPDRAGPRHIQGRHQGRPDQGRARGLIGPAVTPVRRLGPAASLGGRHGRRRGSWR